MRSRSRYGSQVYAGRNSSTGLTQYFAFVEKSHTPSATPESPYVGTVAPAFIPGFHVLAGLRRACLAVTSTLCALPFFRTHMSKTSAKSLTCTTFTERPPAEQDFRAKIPCLCVCGGRLSEIFGRRSRVAGSGDEGQALPTSRSTRPHFPSTHPKSPNCPCFLSR